MKTTTSKNMIYLVGAGIILLAVNAWAWTTLQSGHLSSNENQFLWVAFMVLNMVSLLWAVSLLGLQPLVVACSYAAGGFLAYRGVQGATGVSVAEVTTAGATYGAIGALAIGNVTTKVRMAFFNKGQIPFIFVIAGLLVLDGLLNSKVSGAGWNVIVHALVVPFIFAGISVGLIWMGVSRQLAKPKKSRIKADPVFAKPVAKPVVKSPNVERVSTPKLKSKPEPVVVEEKVAEPIPEPVVEERVEVEPVVIAEKITEEVAVEEEVMAEQFFPLEIDKDDDFVLPAEEAVMLDEEEEVVLAESEVKPEPEPEVEIEEDEPTETEEAASDGDWLSGHLDLLNKIGDK